jgi:hypothetical protein
MNYDDLIQKGFTRQADGSWAKAVVSTNGAGTLAKLECHPWHEPLEADKGQEATTARLHIRFTSVRKRLCDPDNISVKWQLDALRYCGAIDGDEPEKITLEVDQRKAVKGETERTIIRIYEH